MRLRKPYDWTDDDIDTYKEGIAKELHARAISIWEKTQPETDEEKWADLMQEIDFDDNIDIQILNKVKEIEDGNGALPTGSSHCEKCRRKASSNHSYSLFASIRYNDGLRYLTLVSGVVKTIPGYGPKDGEGQMSIFFNVRPLKKDQKQLTQWMGNRSKDIDKRAETVKRVNENSELSASERQKLYVLEMERRAKRRRDRGGSN